MDEQIKVVIRNPDAQDKDFIMATWLNNNRYGSPYFELQEPGAYYRDHAYKITAALCQPDTQIRIACDESNPTWIVGFAVFANLEIYYVYVRKGYRKKGIATLLLKDKIFNKIRSLTKTGASIALTKGFVFEPL